MSTSREFFQSSLGNYNKTYGSLSEQMYKVRSLNDTSDEIKNKIKDYDKMKTSVEKYDEHPEYKDFNYEKSDGAIWLNYQDNKSSTIDGRIEDLQTMIINQNNAYIFGMISITSLLVGTFIIMQ